MLAEKVVEACAGVLAEGCARPMPWLADLLREAVEELRAGARAVPKAMDRSNGEPVSEAAGSGEQAEGTPATDQASPALCAREIPSMPSWAKFNKPEDIARQLEKGTRTITELVKALGPTRGCPTHAFVQALLRAHSKAVEAWPAGFEGLQLAYARNRIRKVLRILEALPLNWQRTILEAYRQAYANAEAA